MPAKDWCPKKWQEEDEQPQQEIPIALSDWPERSARLSSFKFQPEDFQPPARECSARLYYRTGWTALVFWNADIYFTDTVLTFDAMMGLLRSRFPSKFYLQARIERDYVD
jgi:hypothetical protein